MTHYRNCTFKGDPAIVVVPPAEIDEAEAWGTAGRRNPVGSKGFGAFLLKEKETMPSKKYQHVHTPKYPQVVVRFTPDITHYSEDDILGTMGNALRDQGKCSQDEINEFYMQARRGVRAQLITTCKRWVTIKEGKQRVPNTRT